MGIANELRCVLTIAAAVSQKSVPFPCLLYASNRRFNTVLHVLHGMKPFCGEKESERDQ
jgi:hypothetical protein